MSDEEKGKKGQGFHGRVLHVDLSSGRHEFEGLGEDFYRKHLSGAGLGAKVLWDRLKPGADPLGPDNILGFTTGLLTDTGTLFTGRFMVVGKSPLNNSWGDANCGGYFAPYLKRCGIDGVFFQGRSEAPVYLYVDHEKVEVRDAAGLWGLDAVETEKKLKETHGQKAQVACIGPAGEKLCRFAGVANDGGRYAARGGLGAVMGSKHLKAVVAAGKDRVGVADKAKVSRLTQAFNKKLEGGKGLQRILGDRLVGIVGWITRTGPVYTRQPADLWRQILRKFGTSGITAMSAESGDSPIKNWGGIGYTDFPLSRSQKIGAETVFRYEAKKYGCYSCPIRCGGLMKVDGPYPLEETHKPEYETLCAFGSLSLNDDIHTIFKMNDLCNRGGLDTISCGGVVALAVECFENGLLTKADTGGLELRWGNGRDMVRLVEMIIAREGLGDLLAEGARRAAEKIGRGAEKYAVHCGGVEAPMHDPKFDPGFMPLYACEATPGRHTTAAYVHLDLQLLEKSFKRAKKIPGVVTRKQRHRYDGAGEALAVEVYFKMLMDGAGVCLFGTSVGGPMPLCDWLNAVTGWNLDSDEYLVIGERIETLRHAFNVREGLNPIRDFQVNPRIYGQPPFNKGPAKGVTVDLDTMCRSFYQAMSWDLETGRPRLEYLQKLGLEEVARTLYPG
ncbi:MAG: aldehyde ferredoxin oxidoreductase family protein [Thermodesulfobacteriota bacterium]